MPKPGPSTIINGKRRPYLTYAGFLAWLGRRSHARKLERSVTPTMVSTREPLARALNALYPWSVRTYPGRYALLAHILTVKPVTAERYLKPGIDVPQRHRDRMAQYLRAKIAELQHHVAALESARPK